MHTYSDVTAEIGKTKTALYKCWLELTSTINGQQNAAPSWMIGHFIETEYNKIDLAFGWVFEVPEPGFFTDMHNRAHQAVNFVQRSTYASAAGMIGDKVGHWKGAAAANFHGQFIKSMENSVDRQKALTAAVANAYGCVQGVCQLGLESAINTAKVAQQAYQAASRQGGGMSSDGIKMFWNVTAVATGIAAAAVTGGGTLGMWLEGATAVSGFFANLVEDSAPEKKLAIQGGDPIAVTDSFVTAMGKARTNYLQAVQKWEEEARKDMAKATEQYQERLLPLRPTIAPA
ncbi:hypothetical protein Afil01_29560 [Actinorhabdospora filicis]|uniref:Uncharacterized protein n=1 Tax=Actinorhabdospora filicis TaxID=1785913 RepID=A0A9W6SJE6_9ACTN|nr:hypothetical protein [Actinorhabdospora filicis]GLZ78149.1 hypothetical protein Afil01_29560 [Actinorhabdospora filicis]